MVSDVATEVSMARDNGGDVAGEEEVVDTTGEHIESMVGVGIESPSSPLSSSSLTEGSVDTNDPSLTFLDKLGVAIKPQPVCGCTGPTSMVGRQMT
jgi:hypothetical protein